MRAMRLEGVEPHGQFTVIDEFIARGYLNQGPIWMPLWPPACQNHPDFGMAVLNCLQKLKNRPIWTALSSLKCAAGHMLAALSALQQRPYMQLSDNC